MTQTLLVTGANRGLGLEFCKQYLERGWKVYACCRSPEKAQELLSLKQSAGDKLETIPLDVTNPSHLINLKYTLQDQSIDVLINNAGMYGERHVFGEIDSKEWLKVLEVNCVAPLMVVQELAGMIPEGGKVVLISSKMGSIEDNTSGGSYIYRSSKAALNAVAKTLAMEIRPRGISVGVFNPGWVRTDMGGPNGLIDTQTSIRGLINNIDHLNLENSAEFLSYDGTVIPW